MNRPEDVEQRHLFTWAGYAKGKYPELRSLFHIPNGGRRSRVEAAILIGLGVRSGVPDVCLPVSRGGYGALWIEMKARREDGGKAPTKNQYRWGEWLVEQGQAWVVCFGFAEAKHAILTYLDGPPRG